MDKIIDMAFNRSSVSPLIIGTMRLGTWGANLTPKQVEAFIASCFALELVDFDFADIYGHYTTESLFGEVFSNSPHLREKMRITTKCGIKMVTPNRPLHRIKSYDLSADHIKRSVEQSLQSLKTDHIDVLLLHRPDYLMHPAEIAEAFRQLKQEGKVLEFGVSNFSKSQFELLNSYIPLVTNQVEISLQQREAFENGVLDQCLQQRAIPTAWSPLGGGTIFQNNPAVNKIAKALAAKYNINSYDLLLVWLKKHPSDIIPVLGTSKVERIESAKKALNVTITSEEWYTLWQAATGEEIA